MKPAPFEFYAPRTRDEILEVLARYGEDARILSGGQSLVPLMNMRIVQPRILVSINKCLELSYIRHSNGTLACGALTRQADAESSAEVRSACPLLSEAMPLMGGAANRNRGTICGSMAHADPLAEPPAVAVALDAEMVVSSAAGQRILPAEAFFISELTNAMVPGEMLEEVRFPARHDARVAFVEIANRQHGFAVVGVAAQLEMDSVGLCRNARLAAIGVGPTPARLREAERALEGTAITDSALKHLVDAARVSLDPIGSFHADVEYRLQMVGVLARRAVAQAAGRNQRGV